MYGDVVCDHVTVPSMAKVTRVGTAPETVTCQVTPPDTVWPPVGDCVVMPSVDFKLGADFANAAGAQIANANTATTRQLTAVRA
jgi:hypothetical protein